MKIQVSTYFWPYSVCVNTLLAAVLIKLYTYDYFFHTFTVNVLVSRVEIIIKWESSVSPVLPVSKQEKIQS